MADADSSDRDQPMVNNTASPASSAEAFDDDEEVGGRTAQKAAQWKGEASPSGQPQRTSAPLQKRRRVTRACDECRRKKIKCDGKQPCTHCTVYSYECTYDQPSNRRRNPAPQYIENLEIRLKRAEGIIRKYLPAIDLNDPSKDDALPQLQEQQQQGQGGSAKFHQSDDLNDPSKDAALPQQQQPQQQQQGQRRTAKFHQPHSLAAKPVSVAEGELRSMMSGSPAAGHMYMQNNNLYNGLEGQLFGPLPPYLAQAMPVFGVHGHNMVGMNNMMNTTPQMAFHTGMTPNIEGIFIDEDWNNGIPDRRYRQPPQ